MKRAIQVILVVGAMLGVASLAAWGLAVWFLGPYIIWAPEGIEVTAEAPAAVAVGDRIEMTVRVRNNGPEDRTLSAITIELGFIKGFSVNGVEPPFVSSEAATDYRVYRFDHPIPAGETTAVRFTLLAIGEGIREGEALREGRVEVQFESESRISSTTVSTAVSER
ncbi:MAG: hypothetical protein NCW75_03715 [Phycisphaera sp.]|nr:MAG: hypothetical protein NCW75_03715 [Phycisphaera sp.]